MVLSMTLTLAETTLIKLYCECLAGGTHPKIVLNHLISKKKMLYRKQCDSENGSSHLMMIYARNWSFR